MKEMQLCDLFRASADDLVGHDLSPEETARLTAHASNCSRCAGEWLEARERAAALQSLTPWELEAAGVKPPAAGSTADAVFARLAAGEGKIPTRVQFMRAFAVAAAVVLMAGGGLLLSGFLRDGAGRSAGNGGSGIVNNPGLTQASNDGTHPLGEREQRRILDSAPTPAEIQEAMRQYQQSFVGTPGGFGAQPQNVNFGAAPVAGPQAPMFLPASRGQRF